MTWLVLPRPKLNLHSELRLVAFPGLFRSAGLSRSYASNNAFFRSSRFAHRYQPSTFNHHDPILLCLRGLVPFQPSCDRESIPRCYKLNHLNFYYKKSNARSRSKNIRSTEN